MTISEAIRARRSIRKYKPDAHVTDEQVKLLLEAAMYAPSACNTRPWEFVVVRDRAVMDEITELHPYTQMLRTASLAIIVCALPDAQEGISAGFFPQDCGAAVQNILLEAAGMGLGTCWCGVYPRQERMNELKSYLGFECTPYCVIAVGVPSEIPSARGFYEEAKVRYV